MLLGSIKKAPIAVGAIVLMGLLFVPSAIAAYPAVLTGEAKNVSQSMATLTGIVGTGGYETLYGFEYGTTKESKEGTEGQVIPKGTHSEVQASQQVTGLAAGTTYYYRLVAFGNGTPAYGAYKTFTTPDPQIPSFEAGEYPASVAGALDSGSSLELLFTSTAKCGGATLAREIPDMTASLPLNTQFSSCTLSIGGATSLKMNSCYLVLHVGDAGPPYSGTATVSCSKAGDQIEVVNTNCSYKLNPASIVGLVDYVNEEGSGTVNADLSAQNVEVSSKTGALCFLVSSKGSITASFDLGAENQAEEATDFRIGGEGGAQSGVFIGGSPLGFAAEQYPQALISEQDLEDVVTPFKTATTPVTCDKGSWSGSLSGATTALSLGATYEDCTFLGMAATVTMGTCSYVLNVANSGPPYVGSPEVSCTGGNAIGIASSGCNVMIPDQSLSGGVIYTNEGTGSSRAVDVNVAASGVSYMKSGPLCFLVGNGSDGSIGFGFRLYGLQ